MMINNNPYNLPERPPQKQSRTYTEAPLPHYRQQINDPHIYMPMRPSTYIPLAPNLQQYRHAPEIKHFIQSPKNQQQNQQQSFISRSIQKKQIGHSNSLRDSFGYSSNVNIQVKDLADKIQNLMQNVKNNQKRIVELERYTGNSFGIGNSVNSKFDKQTETSILNVSQDTQILFSKFQNQMQENFIKIKQEINSIREQSKFYSNRSLQIQRQKFKQALQISKLSQNLPVHSKPTEQTKKQVEHLRIELQQKLKKNYEFLTSVIGRVQRQFQNGIINIQPNFKPSTIKCSTTAILLRFVECFKVRKHNSTQKNGQIKITLTDNTYYIDSQGHLLDKQQYYLIDSRGNRVKLEQRHIKMLKEENIIL